MAFKPAGKTDKQGASEGAPNCEPGLGPCDFRASDFVSILFLQGREGPDNPNCKRNLLFGLLGTTEKTPQALLISANENKAPGPIVFISWNQANTLFLSNAMRPKQYQSGSFKHSGSAPSWTYFCFPPSFSLKEEALNTLILLNLPALSLLLFLL